MENLPNTPSIIVMNHAQMHGPITSELFFPTKKIIWCTGEMMNKKEVPAYAYKDFWSFKPKWSKWFYKLMSHLIATPFAYLFKNADCLPVYKDMRIISTYKDSVKALVDGAHVIIFPEKLEECNEIINVFQDKFVDLARLYYARTGKELAFVPTYNAPTLKKVVFGKSITYDHTSDSIFERERIINYLMNEITVIAKDLPAHTVVPYANVPRKQYPKSK